MRRLFHLGVVAMMALIVADHVAACTEVHSLLAPNTGILKASVVRKGQPVSAAKVDLYLGGQEASRGLIFESALTDKSGDAVFENLPFGSYEGVIDVPERKTLRLSFHVSSSEPVQAKTGDVTVTIIATDIASEGYGASAEGPIDRSTLVPQAVRRAFRQTSVIPVTDLRGVVQDESGAVIPRVEIELYRSGEKPEVLSKARTDDIGNFAINASGGSYVMKFSMPGFMNAYIPVEIKQGGWAGMKLTMQVAAGCGGENGLATDRFRVEPI